MVIITNIITIIIIIINIVININDNNNNIIFIFIFNSQLINKWSSSELWTATNINNKIKNFYITITTIVMVTWVREFFNWTNNQSQRVTDVCRATSLVSNLTRFSLARRKNWARAREERTTSFSGPLPLGERTLGTKLRREISVSAQTRV